MPKHLTSFDQDAARFARATEQQFSALRSAMRQLQDSSAGLRGALKVPVIKGGNRYSKSTRTSPSILTRALDAGFNSLVNSGVKNAGSFYTSAAQSASSWIDDLNVGQRLR